jgi:hypothetical protein
MSNNQSSLAQIDDKEMLKRLHAFTSRRGNHPAQVDGFLKVAEVAAATAGAVRQPAWVGGIKYNDK